ncbi:MarR family winged helix-turn-helix transcriptional regulator [Bradyrhizobium sp. AZCC 1693]|uniref:MarR family winged helix-turn-helix transcriptional regulator n=1 Tax=Bradyrhizobium sp. AZCC 1693 TaxID=3117029 RepID=UPI002FF044D0
MKQIEQDPGRFPVVHVQEVIRSCIGMNLRLTERLVTRLLEARLRAVGLSAAEFFLMTHIAAVGSDSVGALARHMGLEKSTLSRGVRGLERKGFVEIVVAEFDSRSREVRLTKKGAARLEAAMPICRKIDDEIATIVDRRQVARIADSMSALCRRY